MFRVQGEVFWMLKRVFFNSADCRDAQTPCYADECGIPDMQEFMKVNCAKTCGMCSSPTTNASPGHPNTASNKSYTTTIAAAVAVRRRACTHTGSGCWNHL